MGHMMNGRWVDDDRITADVRGAFVRADSQFRSWVTADGNAGPSGSGGFKAEPGRYHLFVSYNCPWAHRTIIFRKLKKLENVISMSLADKPKTAGWAYSEVDRRLSTAKKTASFVCIKFTRPRMPTIPAKLPYRRSGTASGARS